MKKKLNGRSSIKKVTFKFFALFTGEKMCCSLFLLTSVSCGITKFLRAPTYFEEHM